jgi:hypothetical protein
MQTLRDAATLAVLILLALTLRVNVSGAPVELDLDTPAQASAANATPVEPAVTPTLDLAAPPESECCASTVTQHLGALAIPGMKLDRPETGFRRFVLERNGKRVVVVLGNDESDLPDPPPATAPDICDGTPRAQLSC